MRSNWIARPSDPIDNLITLFLTDCQLGQVAIWCRQLSSFQDPKRLEADRIGADLLNQGAIIAGSGSEANLG